MGIRLSCVIALVAACGSSKPAGGVDAPSGGGDPLGTVYSGGQYNLGPVDYAETQWHNACAPGTKYAPSVQTVEGSLLAGLWNGIPDVAADCDACILVTTAMGKTALLRIVTYGDTTMNSIDVSASAYNILNSGEYPRAMSWQFAKCDDTGPMIFEFQTGSSEYWTSLWVRNPRVPITKVEVQSANHPDFVELDRGSDGTLTDAGGFGKGAFMLRITGLDGQLVTQSFAWPASGVAGLMVTGDGNFD